METIKVCIASNTAHISELVDQLLAAHLHPPDPSPPVMYMDLGGISLSRDGSISIITILTKTALPSADYYLVDAHTLGAQAFNTPGTKGQTLKGILQDPSKTKVFFDVRNDSDALFAHYGVALQGIEDV